MNASALRQLEHEIHRFRVWADGHAPADRHGSWECDYEDWPTIYAAFRAFLGEGPCEEWDAGVVDMLLYAIARDNDCGALAAEATRRTDCALLLARASLHTTERDAKWQLAVRISRLSERRSDVEALLLELTKDEDEYVRRQALMGLGRIQSPAVEDLVEAAWGTGDEYQRIGALYALHRVNSPRLAEFRDRAVADGRKYVVDYARRTRLEAKD